MGESSSRACRSRECLSCTPGVLSGGGGLGGGLQAAAHAISEPDLCEERTSPTPGMRGFIFSCHQNVKR